MLRHPRWHARRARWRYIRRRVRFWRRYTPDWHEPSPWYERGGWWSKNNVVCSCLACRNPDPERDRPRLRRRLDRMEDRKWQPLTAMTPAPDPAATPPAQPFLDEQRPGDTKFGLGGALLALKPRLRWIVPLDAPPTGPDAVPGGRLA